MDDIAQASQFRRVAELSAAPESRVLALGDVTLWRSIGHGNRDRSEFHLADIESLTAAKLAEINPDLVLSPVVTARFDCLDVAHLLSSLGFSGSYRAIARSLPDPEVVRREVLGACPGLDFDITALPKLDRRAN